MNMKLIHKEDYLSIGKFNDVELSDFAVLTGINGSGKTHLLKGIANGSFVIDGTTADEMFYFDYTDFLIANKINDEKISELRARMFSVYQNNQQLIRDIIVGKGEGHTKRMDAQIRFPINYDIFVGENTSVVDFRNAIEKIHQNSIPIELQHPTKVEFESIHERYLHVAQKFPEYWNIAQKKQKNICNMKQDDFEPLSLTEHVLNEEVKEWQLEYRANTFEESKKHEKDNDFVEWDKWNMRFGQNPVDIINQILSKYQLNDYRLRLTNPIRGKHDQQSYQPYLVLKNNEREVELQDLSSGEKVLIALALMVHQREKQAELKILLLDEIDATLHPSMIRNFHKVIIEEFIEKGKKVIFATHSATTVASLNDIYIVRPGNQLNKIKKTDKAEALSTLTAGYLTFEEGIGLLQKQKPQIYLEGTTDIDYWKKAFEILPEFADVQGAFEYKNGNGDEARKKYKSLSKAPSGYILSKHIFVFDCDATMREEENANLYRIKNSKNDASLVEAGIENLFSENFLMKAYNHKNDFLDKKTEEIRGKETTTYKVNEDEKRNLCNWICENGTAVDFEKFKPIFERIRKILKTD